MLDKTYRPQDVEETIYAAWEESGAFAADMQAENSFCIMMPPPNVTGSLHMGHALDQTIQDTLTRYHRMRGRAVLWQPGTDHAGIATQMMVERKLQREGKSRLEIGREAFLQECWTWKEASQGNILGQLRRLGASPDWSRERFTMDEGLSRAVIKAFVSLYREGLIYKDKRLVNWDCALQTAISDLETVPTDVNGHLWHFDYPLADDADQVITVATTRPETMLGDTAVAVHPEDDRFKELHGKLIRLPLVGREIPIIADEYSDPEKGTGAVKITPAHDFNDFDVGKRHNLPAVNVFDTRGRINEAAPQMYRGLDRFEARRQVVADMEAEGRLRLVEKHRHVVPHGDRSGQPIEPFMTDQWYCDAATLAKPAIQAVETGKTRFVPKQWENTYFEWMRNIQPWCISRQLWWGHQIPAWYGPDGRVFVGLSEQEAQNEAADYYGERVELERDPDVLDTWFSSGLWPFSTLGWPEETEELKKFYPTSVLVTGFDIIFFWVARMMMQGLRFTNDVPFADIYIHGLVRDEKGKKMSKTTGNVIDPVELIETYGADALRYAILASTAQGRDIKFGASRVEGYRNFVTKLWNAARFVEMNGGGEFQDFVPNKCQVQLNRWIVGEVTKTASLVTTALDSYKFNDAAQNLYHFIWDIYCDWYVELAKPILNGDDLEGRSETVSCASWVLQQVLHLMHPMAPFVSEELWRKLFNGREMLITATWPELDHDLVDQEAKSEIDWLIKMVGGIRAARSELNVPAGAKLPLEVHGANDSTIVRLDRHEDAIRRLARLHGIEFGNGHVKSNSLQVIVDETTFAMAVDDVVDLGEERNRLQREIKKVELDISKIEGKLANQKFLARAPADVVDEQRERKRNAQDARERLVIALDRIT